MAKKKYNRQYVSGQTIAKRSIAKYGLTQSSMKEHKRVASNLSAQKRQYFYKEMKKALKRVHSKTKIGKTSFVTRDYTKATNKIKIPLSDKRLYDRSRYKFGKTWTEFKDDPRGRSYCYVYKKGG